VSAPRWSEAEVVVEVDPTVPAGYMQHQVVVPAGCAEDAGVGTRVAGTLDGTRFSRVVVAGSRGERLLRFGRAWLRDAGIEGGDVVLLRVRVDPDPDAVEVPDELAEALAADPALEHRWEALTAGRRRTLAYPLERAKRPETRARRVQAILDELRALDG
jgi:hypothetical protein